MINSVKEKVAAIIPALNEEANIGNVLKVLLSSKYLDEIILVDDGSQDKTAEIGRKLKVKVVKLSENGGKGNAMKQGVKSTDAKIIVFFDADLIGLTKNHIFSLVYPIVKNEADMCVGMRDRLWGLPKLIAKMDPLMAIGGERAVKRDLFEKIPDKFLQGFAVETALNYYCSVKKLPVKYVVLPDLKVVIKEKKWGFAKGFLSRIKMIFEIIKIRLKLCIKRQF